jgi:DinB superfamily
MASPGKRQEDFDLDTAYDILFRTPAVLNSMLSGLSDSLTTGGAEDNWAPFDIVGHLIHGELTDWIPRARIILEQGENRTFVPFDRFAQFELSKGKALNHLLAEFEMKRHENLETLRSWNLSDEQLVLTGVHPELGEVTLSELIASWVAHDLTHIRQIVVHLAKKFGPSVGPWKDYLSILD